MIFSECGEIPDRSKRWRSVRAIMTKGKMKWKVKNRVRVTVSTENPPLIHWTR